MMVGISWNVPSFLKMSKRITNEAFLVLAATMQTNRGMIFDKEGAYNGHAKWAPLKFRNGQILKDRGTLSKSIGPTNNGIVPTRNPGGIVNIESGINLVEIGTNVKYAGVHDQYGDYGRELVIKPKNKKALKVPYKVWEESSRGKYKGQMTLKNKFFFAKSVTIPARPFSNINEQDADEFSKTMENFFKKVMDND